MASKSYAMDVANALAVQAARNAYQNENVRALNANTSGVAVGKFSAHESEFEAQMTTTFSEGVLKAVKAFKKDKRKVCQSFVMLEVFAKNKEDTYPTDEFKERLEATLDKPKMAKWLKEKGVNVCFTLMEGFHNRRMFGGFETVIIASVMTNEFYELVAE